MNAKNPRGLVGYRTPTPSAHNPMRLLKAERGTVGEMSKGQALVARAQLCEMQDGNKDPQWSDIEQRLNRHERRVVASEAREHKRQLARRDARKKQRADKRAKKFARGLVEL